MVGDPATRFPLTLMYLRYASNPQTLGSLEYDVWLTRIMKLVSRGETECVRKNWEWMARNCWVGVDDPC